MNIKCIGCYDLHRRVLKFDGRRLIVYKCSRFHYACAMSGLLRPGSGIVKAVEDCPEKPLSHCILCSSTKIYHYGQDIVSLCKEHDADWGKWLYKHPERRKHLAPRGRSIKANWVEVFREFVEDMRLETK